MKHGSIAGIVTVLAFTDVLDRAIRWAARRAPAE